MPGDDRQKFANLRAFYGFMYGHPGKKLLFMGGEFGQTREWHQDRSLDWHLLDQGPYHRGLQRLVSDLNHVYRREPALHQVDFDPAGFQWIDCNDWEASVVAFVRRARDPEDFLVVVSNFTPVVRSGYRIGVPRAGFYRELVNTDAEIYGGGNAGNAGGVHSEPVPRHGLAQSIPVTLPPLATLILKPEASGTPVLVGADRDWRRPGGGDPDVARPPGAATTSITRCSARVRLRRGRCDGRSAGSAGVAAVEEGTGIGRVPVFPGSTGAAPRGTGR